MAVRVALPADLGNLHALLESQGRLTLSRRTYGRLLAQLALSETCAVFGDEEASEPLAIGGIAPLPNGAGEIWFGVRPGGLGSDLLPFVRAMRRLLFERRAAYPGGLMCMVQDGHEPGERLAALLACRPQPVFIGDHREWTYGLRDESILR
jgi:hypothetical protein